MPIDREESWPLFHFWLHHLWSKLTSSTLKFCRRENIFNDFFSVCFYLFTITPFTKVYSTLLTLQSNPTFLHRTEKKERETTYNGLSKEHITNARSINFHSLSKALLQLLVNCSQSKQRILFFCGWQNLNIKRLGCKQWVFNSYITMINVPRSYQVEIFFCMYTAS